MKILNKYDEKYNGISQMLIYKQLHPPKFSYDFVCKFNGVVLNIMFDSCTKVVVYEKFLYNINTNNLFHYRITIYSSKTLALIYPLPIIKKKKNKRSKYEKEVSENTINIINNLYEFVDICKKENNIFKRREMVSKALKKINDFIKNNINNDLLLK
jgi:hypothetical protein